MAVARTVWPTALLLAATALTVAAPALAQQQVKPNILFILADNTGYGDIGAYGGRPRRR